jgi:hypothetical protein
VAQEYPVRLADEARVGQRVDRGIEIRTRQLVQLDRDFPERAPPLAAHRIQVLDHQALVRDDLQDAGERARTVHGLDQQYLGDLHDPPAYRLRGSDDPAGGGFGYSCAIESGA